MKGVNDKSFLNLWQLVLDATNLALDVHAWRVGNVQWRRDRHSYRSSTHSFTLEVHTIEQHERERIVWRLFVVKEHWWGSDGKNAVKSNIWARVLVGRREAVLKWFREQGRDRLPTIYGPESGLSKLKVEET